MSRSANEIGDPFPVSQGTLSDKTFVFLYLPINAFVSYIYGGYQTSSNCNEMGYEIPPPPWEGGLKRIEPEKS
jgi:hypothetical protein